MPLAVAPLNEEFKITKIMGDDLKVKLEKLGVVVNKSIKVVSVDDGKLVCMVECSKVVIDKLIAVKILVA